jgi:hypothetical protein
MYAAQSHPTAGASGYVSPSASNFFVSRRNPGGFPALVVAATRPHYPMCPKRLIKT